MIDLVSLASKLPNVTLGVACAGTVLESRSFATDGKVFLFVSKRDARLKLGSAGAEAKSAGFVVGANGWVKIPTANLPPLAVLERWLAESHALAAHAPRAAASSRGRTRRR